MIARQPALLAGSPWRGSTEPFGEAFCWSLFTYCIPKACSTETSRSSLPLAKQLLSMEVLTSWQEIGT